MRDPVDDGEQAPFGEDLFGDEGAVQGAGHPAVDGRMQERFSDPGWRETHIQGRVDVDVQFGLAAAEAVRTPRVISCRSRGGRPGRACISPKAQATT
nr:MULTISPECIES: hypothetical protein [unclassified Nonomuraea]